MLFVPLLVLLLLFFIICCVFVDMITLVVVYCWYEAQAMCFFVVVLVCVIKFRPGRIFVEKYRLNVIFIRLI